MKFVDAIKNQEARTANGMKARKSSANACVDLFYNIGASRGKNIVPAFTAAYVENSDLALRIAQWARDVRGGSGERELFRDVLRHLEKTSPEDALRLMKKVPEVGRWDDLFVFTDPKLKWEAYNMLARIACKAMSELVAQGKADFLLIKDDEVRDWWEQHQEADRKAREAREKKEREAKIRKEALAKLTAEEKKILGIKK